MESSTSDTRRRIWSVFKAIFFVFVLVFVARSAIRLWKSAPPESIHIDWIWLVPAAVLYFIGWMPSVWLWGAFLTAMHQPVDRWNVLRAYYIGHIGKYSPGKALVPVIRAALIKAAGASTVLAFVAVAYETLIFMASGAILGLAVAPFAIDEAHWSKIPAGLKGIREYRHLFSSAVILAGFASIPVISWLFTKIGRRLMARKSADPTQLPSISPSLIAWGIAICAVGWVCHALSMGFVVTAIVGQGFQLTQLPLWIAACTASTVGGFVAVFAPGGIGVREGLLIEILKHQPEIGPAFAILIACVLRSVWFAAELIVSGVLYVAGARKSE